MLALDLQNLTRDKFAWLRQVCADPAIGHLAARIAALLVDYINPKNGAAWPSQLTLAEAAGVTTRGVQKALKALEQAGYLHITVQKGRANTNRYRPFLRNTNHGSSFAPELANPGDAKPEPEFARLPESYLSPLPPFGATAGLAVVQPSPLASSDRAVIGQQVIELARTLGSRKAARLGGYGHD